MAQYRRTAAATERSTPGTGDRLRCGASCRANRGGRPVRRQGRRARFDLGPMLASPRQRLPKGANNGTGKSIDAAPPVGHAMRRRLPGIVCSAAVILAVLALPAGANTAAPAGPAATTFANWPAYLLGPTHSSANSAAAAITPAKVATLTRVWRFAPAGPTMTGQPGTSLFASPTVFNGRVYIGANTGVFYALDEATGHVVWHRFMGFVTKKTCSARGFISTATVAPDPASGALTVYVAAADGYLYALNAADGALRWRSVVAIPSTTVNDTSAAPPPSSPRHWPAFTPRSWGRATRTACITRCAGETSPPGRCGGSRPAVHHRSAGNATRRRCGTARTSSSPETPP